MPGDRRFEIRDARGRIAGIDLNLNARIVGFRNRNPQAGRPNEMSERRKLLVQIFKELNKWTFQKDRPPTMDVFLDVDANDRQKRRANFSVEADRIEKNGHGLESVAAVMELRGELLTITRLHAEDSMGGIDARIDFNTRDRSGRFDFSNSLQITPLLSAWFGLHTPGKLVLGGRQDVTAAGEFKLNGTNKPVVSLTGRFNTEAMMLGGVLFDRVDTAFSWGEGGLFLRGMKLEHQDGVATGKALIQWPNVRLALNSTLPARVYKPLFVGQPLEAVIGKLSEREGAAFNVRLEGGFDATDKRSWAYAGTGSLKNVNYLGIPVNEAQCSYVLSTHELDFYDGSVEFNYANYKLRKDFNGPKSGTAKIGRIRYISAKKTVEVENVAGEIWAAPLVRLFAPRIADALEVYRFHKPPKLNGSGVVDVTPRNRTSLDVAFSSDAPADYRFLGQNLTLSRPGGMVAIRGPEVKVSDLKLGVFDGNVDGSFTSSKGSIAGELSWTRLSIPPLCSTYGLQMKGGGNITGRMEFSLKDNKVETMAGEGLLAMENAELFSVPIFGPLSGLISTVVNDRRAGYERAKSAFFTYRIKDGILRSNDFHTATTSLTFAGDGELDLSKRTIDMTMRMNARGLLGLITLPLRPFYGMFQFRGTGPLNETKWENVMFTAPPAGQKELLKAPPKALVVPSEN